MSQMNQNCNSHNDYYTARQILLFSVHKLKIFLVHIISLVYYRPQRSCGKVKFLQVCVKNSVRGVGCVGGCIPACIGADTPLPSACWYTPSGHTHRGQTPSCPMHVGIHPLGRHLPPPGHTPPPPLQRTVCILLECILVCLYL